MQYSYINTDQRSKSLHKNHIPFPANIANIANNNAKQQTPQVVSLSSAIDLQQHIPNLPLLDYMQQFIAQDVLDTLPHTVFLLIQHPFSSTFALIKKLIQLGAKPKNIFLSDKYYSTSANAKNLADILGINYYPFTPNTTLGQFEYAFRAHLIAVWNTVMRKILHNKKIDTVIVGDDAGYAISLMPSFIAINFKVAGFEQTTSGLRRIENCEMIFPVISVAASAAKIKLESTIIAKDIIKHISSIMPLLRSTPTKVCGIIGNGNIGLAIANKMLALGFSVLVFDKNTSAYAKIKDKVTICNSTAMLVENTDIIFGCSGTNSLTDVDVSNIMNSARDKAFISCSSSDIEWLSLLQHIQKNFIGSRLILQPETDIRIKSNANAVISVYNGGYPINFDKKNESIPLQDIQLTRSLNFCAIMQAITIAARPKKDSKTIHAKNTIQMLCPDMQQKLAQYWLKTQTTVQYPAALTEIFENTHTIHANSTGKPSNTANLITD